MARPADVVLPRPRAASGGSSRARDVLAVIEHRQSVRLLYQPLVDIGHGRVAGYEALARFGPRTTTSPTTWFAAAEQLRHAADLEALLIDQALTERASLPPRRFLSVNVRPDLLSSAPVVRALEAHTDLNGVVLELTEQVEFGRTDALRRQLVGLRERGAQLALDDVGAGWAGLRQVAELRPDIVKLDRSLVTEADRDRLCSRLGSLLLVEGVETSQELDAFARLGVPLAQGWVFGKPALAPPQIDEDLAVRLKFMAGMTRHVEKVASVVDVTARVSRHPAVYDGWAPATDGQVVVLLDEEGHPVGVQQRDADDVVHTAPAITVLATEELSQALLRGMTRPSPIRFAPMVCVDRAGRYVGLVTVDALARASARRQMTESY
jgi:EAL domain-containing protein (putative c-di-GMP-specific phosphodiesterase class I)